MWESWIQEILHFLSWSDPPLGSFLLSLLKPKGEWITSIRKGNENKISQEMARSLSIHDLISCPCDRE